MLWPAEWWHWKICMGGFPFHGVESSPPLRMPACKCFQLLLRHSGAESGAKGRVYSPALKGQLMAKSEQKNQLVPLPMEISRIHCSLVSHSAAKKTQWPILCLGITAGWRKADSKYLLWDQFCLKCNVSSRTCTQEGQLQEQGCVYIKTEEHALETLAWNGKSQEEFESHTMTILIFFLVLSVFSCSGKLLRMEQCPFSYGGFGRKSTIPP